MLNVITESKTTILNNVAFLIYRSDIIYNPPSGPTVTAVNANELLTLLFIDGDLFDSVSMTI